MLLHSMNFVFYICMKLPSNAKITNVPDGKHKESSINMLLYLLIESLYWKTNAFRNSRSIHISLNILILWTENFEE